MSKANVAIENQMKEFLLSSSGQPPLPAQLVQGVADRATDFPGVLGAAAYWLRADAAPAVFNGASERSGGQTEPGWQRVIEDRLRHLEKRSPAEFSLPVGEGTVHCFPIHIDGVALAVLAVSTGATPLSAGTEKGLQLLAEGASLRIELEGAWAAARQAEDRLSSLVRSSERKRIAREMHDGLAQTLFALTLGLRACLAAAKGDADGLGSRLEELQDLAQQSLRELRQYIYDLHAAQDKVRLVEGLRKYVAELREAEILSVDLTVHGEEGPLPQALERDLFRVAQEGLTNVVKHAAAHRATVEVVYQTDQIVLRIEDDGRGFDTERVLRVTRGIGLRSMRARVEGHGGRLAVAAAPSAGTALTASVPLEGEQESG